MSTTELTPEILRRIMPNLPRLQREEYTPLLNEAMLEFEITNELRAAAFLAQMAHESNELTRWVENLNYSAQRLTEVWPKRFPTLAAAAPFAHNPQALAERTYGGRLGNNKQGDGYKYRGMFPIQATGGDMFRKAAKALDIPGLAENPSEYINDHLVGFRVSAWIFAVEKGCNPLADKRQFKAITFKINGGYNGLEDRIKFYDRVLRVLPDDFHLDDNQSTIAEDDTPPDFVVEKEKEDEANASDSQTIVTTPTVVVEQQKPATPPEPAPVPGINASKIGAGLSAGGVVSTVVTILSGAKKEIVIGLVAVLLLSVLVWLVSRFWYANQVEERKENAREAEAKRAHEITMAKIKSAQNTTAPTVEVK